MYDPDKDVPPKLRICHTILFFNLKSVLVLVFQHHHIFTFFFVKLQVFVWNVDAGVVECKIAHSAEDSLTTVAWSPDGRKIAVGGNRGQFYQCDSKGAVLETKEGVRVQALAFRKDSKFILAADTHHRIRAYNLNEDEFTDYTVLQENHGIMSFTLDNSDRYALLNIAKQVSFCHSGEIMKIYTPFW